MRSAGATVVRRATAACAALLLSAPALGVAAPRPQCNLVVDASGDARDPYLGSMRDDARFDLLSGDIASDGRNVTVVMRLAELPESPDPLVGTILDFQFSVDGADHVYLSADIAGLARGFSAWERDLASPGFATHRVGVATGVVDVARKEVRITTSVSTFRQRIRPSSTLSGLQMDSTRWYGYGGDPTVGRAGTGPQIDKAESAAKYRAGTRSCVLVGR